jgi:hypothetical protein
MPIFPDMHMNGFTRVAFVGKKEETISLKLKNVWHG